MYAMERFVCACDHDGYRKLSEVGEISCMPAPPLWPKYCKAVCFDADGSFPPRPNARRLPSVVLSQVRDHELLLHANGHA